MPPGGDDSEGVGAPFVQRVVIAEELKLNVRRVKVAGLNKTKNDIVVEQVKPLLSAKDLQNVMLRVQETQQRLQAMDIFDRVEVLLDKAKGKGAKADQVDVTFFVREKGSLHLGLSAHAGTQSGDASLAFSWRNMLGRGECLKLTSSTTLPHFGHSQQLEFHKKYYADLTKRMTVLVGRTKTDHPFSGFKENSTGSILQCQFPSRIGHHILSWHYMWREVLDFSINTPMQIRAHGGHSLKSSIIHNFERDGRDDSVDPYHGYLLTTTHEIAGLGGDTAFGKAEVHVAIYEQLWRDLVGSITLWTGVLRPLTASKINDRFFLGGPTTVRGFRMWGLGPHEGEHSCGGDAYWATGLHLYHPVPFVRSSFINRYLKSHVFLTAGNLVPFGVLAVDPLGVLQEYRLSCGIGLALRVGIARLELNYCIPIRSTSADKLHPGLQISISLENL